MIQATHPTAIEPAATLVAQPWYVCLTKPRQEHLATQRLEEQGYAVFLPELSTWVRQHGDWRRKSTVMFPRYVFVRPSHVRQAIGPVRSTPGVSTLVSFGHVLACLRADRLAALRKLVAARSEALPHQPFAAGTAVVFCAGPLKAPAASSAAWRLNVCV